MGWKVALLLVKRLYLGSPSCGTTNRIFTLSTRALANFSPLLYT